MSLCCITSLVALLEVSSKRSSCPCLLTLNCPLMGYSDIPEELSCTCWQGVFVSVGKGIPSVFRQSNAWSRRETRRPCSGAACRCGASLTGGYPCHGGRSSYWREPLCIARAWCASSQCSFSRPWPSWCSGHLPRGWSTSWASGLHTPWLRVQHTHPSFYPRPSCWPCCAEGDLPGSQMYHRGIGALTLTFDLHGGRQQPAMSSWHFPPSRHVWAIITSTKWTNSIWTSMDSMDCHHWLPGWILFELLVFFFQLQVGASVFY